MKKILALAAAAVVMGTFAFAQPAVEVGVRGGLNMNLGSKLSSDMQDFADSMDLKNKVLLGGNFGVFAHIGLAELGSGTLSIQPEVDFVLNNGMDMEGKYDYNSYKIKVASKSTYTSLDIPVLVSYDISAGSISVRPFVGPQLSFPLGKMKTDVKVKVDGKLSEDDSKTEDMKIKGPTFGMVFGCGVAVPVGPVMIGGDVRYALDFNYLKEDESSEKEDYVKRAGLGINLTVAYKF